MHDYNFWKRMNKVLREKTCCCIPTQSYGRSHCCKDEKGFTKDREVLKAGTWNWFCYGFDLKGEGHMKEHDSEK